MVEQARPLFVSIIIPAYNATRTIRMCLDSILRQDYPSERYEVIIVDNNSTDRLARPRANSMRPALSDTLSKARRTRIIGVDRTVRRCSPPVQRRSSRGGPSDTIAAGEQREVVRDFVRAAGSGEASRLMSNRPVKAPATRRLKRQGVKGSGGLP